MGKERAHSGDCEGYEERKGRGKRGEREKTEKRAAGKIQMRF